MSVRMISVYPGEAVEEVLGWGSSQYNVALQVFAHLLRKQVDLDKILKPTESEQLVEILDGFDMRGKTIGLLRQVEQVAEMRRYQGLLKALKPTGIGDLAIWKFWFGLKARKGEDHASEEG